MRWASGELVAEGMRETLAFNTSNTIQPLTRVLFGSLDAVRAIQAAAALHPLAVSNFPFDQLRVNQSMQVCKVLPRASTDPPYPFDTLQCDTPTGNMLDEQGLHFVAWSGGALAFTNDTYSYPRDPIVSGVSSDGCQALPSIHRGARA